MPEASKRSVARKGQVCARVRLCVRVGLLSLQADWMWLRPKLYNFTGQENFYFILLILGLISDMIDNV